MTHSAENGLLTGDDYLESLRDGREVYIDGEKVEDVTSHPAFRNSARSMARLYDALHEPGKADILLGVDRSGSLWRCRVAAHGPCANLLRPCGIEGLEAE